MSTHAILILFRNPLTNVHSKQAIFCSSIVCSQLFSTFSTAGGGSAVTVRGFVGQDVTLPCRYDTQRYGSLAVCWGRGQIPNRGCGNEIIRTDGAKVTSRASEQYQLLGQQHEGDISLTIRQAQERDSGTYGCRVDIPGWFNDHKHHMVLTIEPGERHIVVSSDALYHSQCTTALKQYTACGVG